MGNLNAVTTARSRLCLAPILDMVLFDIASQRTVWLVPSILVPGVMAIGFRQTRWWLVLLRVSIPQTIALH